MDELIDATSKDGINWEAVESIAGEGAAQPGQEGAAPQGTPRLSPGEEVAAALFMLGNMVAPVLPSVAKIYTADTCQKIAEGIDPVCRKYGWFQTGFQWAAEVQAAITVLPIAMATAVALKHDVAVLKAAKAAREAEKAEGREAAKPEGVPDA